MGKKGVFALFILSMINFVSAYNYRVFSLESMLNTLDVTTAFLIVILVVSFALIFVGLTKSIFKENRGTAGIIAGSIAFLITYGANQLNWNLNSFFRFGISSEAMLLITWVVVIIAFFIAWKKKVLKYFFLITGILLIVLGATETVYSKGTSIILGIIILGISLIGFKKKVKNPNNPPENPTNSPENNNNGPSRKELERKGKRVLEKAAQSYYSWAKNSGNTENLLEKNFIAYLNNNNYGKNRREICKNLHISKGYYRRAIRRGLKKA